MGLKYIKLEEGETFTKTLKMSGKDTEFEIAIVSRTKKSGNYEYNVRYASRIGVHESTTFKSVFWCGYAKSLYNMSELAKNWVDIIM